MSNQARGLQLDEVILDEFHHEHQTHLTETQLSPIQIKMCSFKETAVKPKTHTHSTSLCVNINRNKVVQYIVQKKNQNKCFAFNT